MSHVAFLLPGIDRLGGAESQVLLLATGLRRRGWRVSVVALSGTGGQTALKLSAAGIEFASLGMRKGLADPRGWTRLRRWLRRERPGVVHAHLPHAALLARWMRLAAPVPVLIDTLHSSATGGRARRIAYRISARIPDRVTAVSQAVAAAHLQAGMVRPGTLTVLPNGIDTESFCPDAALRAQARRELGLGNEFVWLAVGRLDPVKDYPALLQAMTGAAAPARLLIAGDGPGMEPLRNLAARLGLDARVRFLGFTAAVERCMNAADGFVLCSLWEGLPVALLEAAACALPLVATDVAGTGEAMRAIECDGLVPPGSPAALAEAMNRVMQLAAEERCRAGELLRRRVIEQFSMGSVLDRWERLYRSEMARG